MRQRISRRLLTEMFYAALKAVNPYESVTIFKDRILSTYRTAGCDRILVMGFGKAACPMAKAIEDDLISLIYKGCVITKYGHCTDTLQKIQVYEAGHPLPDGNGVAATEKIANILGDADEHTLVVCLISGGGSALLVSPYEGIALHEKQIVTDLLLKAGANIYELNTVRKHMSKVKGGRLAEIAYPATTISLILSDVIGDRLDVIASGPTSPDMTTYQDALEVLKKYNLTSEAPESFLNILNKGMKGLLPETPKEGNKVFEKVENIIIGSNRKALESARRMSESLGFNTTIISAEIAGEAREVGKWIAQQAIEIHRGKKAGTSVCLISGGETTVTVKGDGRGGRNMELALSFAMDIEGIDGITLLSAGTDGTDGPTDAAGAIVDGRTIQKAKVFGLDPREYLRNNDSYNFFRKIDELLVTGPSGTNVMDIQITLVL